MDDLQPPKAYMRMLKCGECGHSITGEIKRRKSRSYTYYHCAHHSCQQHRQNVSEQVITDQLIDAFKPFQSLTPEGLNKLSATLQKSAGELDLRFQSLKGRLADQRIKLTARLDEIDAMHKAGNLAEAEYLAIRGISEKAIEQVDIDQHIQRRELRQNFDERIWIIESLYLASHCMRLSKKNTERAELAKICLSNIFLGGRTLRYSYRKPFDVLANLPEGPHWWRWRESLSFGSP